MTADFLIEGVLKIREASEFLKVHPNTLRRWSEMGVVRAYRFGPRRERRFKISDLEALLKD
ncbi:MAG: helix-turn-helix domain-containing protein [Dehalococcoidia bacterium]